MSRNGILLDVSQPPQLAERLSAWADLWPSFSQQVAYPRSKWLREAESLLAEYYPAASSADRRLTARHYAVSRSLFYLAQGGNVP